MNDQAYIEFPTHGVHIYRRTDRIYCFKFTARGFEPLCDFDIFDQESDAIEYILKPFETERWTIKQE